MGLRVLECFYRTEDENTKEKYRDANGNENGRGNGNAGFTSQLPLRQFPTVTLHFPLSFSFRRPITPTSYHHIHFPRCFFINNLPYSSQCPSLLLLARYAASLPTTPKQPSLTPVAAPKEAHH